MKSAGINGEAFWPKASKKIVFTIKVIPRMGYTFSRRSKNNCLDFQEKSVYIFCDVVQAVFP
jgi:hypothetical protein